MNIPTELIDYFKRGEVVLFIGAGVSINSGLPGWIDLISPLTKSTGYAFPSVASNIATEHLLIAAQYFENRNGRNALVRHLAEQLDTLNKTPSNIHNLITLLPVQTIFTTNFDDLLERSYKNTSRRINLVVSDMEFAFQRNLDVTIVKLCGELTRPDSIVITKRDFNVYSETHHGILEKLRATLETKTVFFLGYGMQDPFLNQIWDCINLSFGKYQRYGYSILFDADDLAVDDLRKRNIIAINIDSKNNDKSKLIANWLEELLAHIQ